MQLKRTLFAGGLASMLLLAACNGESTEKQALKKQALKKKLLKRHQKTH